MNSYYILGLLVVILVIVFVSSVYSDRRKESEAKVKTENQEEMPNGIQINEYGDLSAAGDYEGIYIKVSSEESTSDVEAKLIIDGIVGVFVHPGAAMSTWQEFPADVIFHVKDLAAGKMYVSRHEGRSISWDGTPDFGPTDLIVHKRFNGNLFRPDFFPGVEILSSKLKLGTSIEVYAVFRGIRSNTLKVTME